MKHKGKKKSKISRELSLSDHVQFIDCRGIISLQTNSIAVGIILPSGIHAECLLPPYSGSHANQVVKECRVGGLSERCAGSAGVFHGCMGKKALA